MKTLIAGVVLIASLALTGEAAMAAGSAVHRKVAHVAHPHAAARVVARDRYAPAPMSFDVEQFIQSMLGGPLPPQYARIVQDAMRESAHHRSSGSSTYEPSYDNSPTIDNSSSAAQEQALSDQENQINQQNNDMAAMNASNAAAEQMNDAANAAALQTELNANN
jgi:hypothetical protein